MAISTIERFYDGGEDFSGATLNGVFLAKLYRIPSVPSTYLVNPSEITVSAGGNGRTSNGTIAYARQYATGGTARLSFLPTGSPTTLVMGYALSSNTTANPGRELLAVRYQGQDIFVVKVNNAKKLELYSASATLLGTSTLDAIGLGIPTYRYVEVGLYLNGASSTIEIRISNTTQISWTGTLSQSVFDEIQFRHTGANSATLHDDIYIHYGTGSIATSDYLGDIAVYAILPDADGSPLEWARTTGSVNYQRIDNIPIADPPTEYLFEDTNGQKNYSSMDALNAGATSIVGVSLVCYLGKGGFGGSAVNTKVKYKSSGGTEYDGSTFTLTPDYQYYRHTWVTSPASGTAWTKAEIDAGFFGVEKVV